MALGNRKPPPLPFSPGQHVQPGPVASFCGKGSGGMVIIHFEHSTGSTEFVVDQEWAKGLINQLQQVTGGITVPSLTPPLP